MRSARRATAGFFCCLARSYAASTPWHVGLARSSAVLLARLPAGHTGYFLFFGSAKHLAGIERRCFVVGAFLVQLPFFGRGCSRHALVFLLIPNLQRRLAIIHFFFVQLAMSLRASA